jgi:hypothetical protein
MAYYKPDCYEGSPMRVRVVQRCKRDSAQCTPTYGTRAECHKMDTAHAWECPQCGRTYSDLDAWQYREEHLERIPEPV